MAQFLFEMSNQGRSCFLRVRKYSLHMFDEICKESTFLIDALAPSVVSYLMASFYLCISLVGLMGLFMGGSRKAQRSAWLFILAGFGTFAIWAGYTKHESLRLHGYETSGEYKIIEGKIDHLYHDHLRSAGSGRAIFGINGKRYSFHSGIFNITPGKFCMNMECGLSLHDNMRLKKSRHGDIMQLERCDALR